VRHTFAEGAAQLYMQKNGKVFIFNITECRAFSAHKKLLAIPA